MSLRLRPALFSLMALLPACGKDPPPVPGPPTAVVGATATATASASPTASASASPAFSASAAPSASASAAPSASPLSDLTTAFAGSPTAGTRRSETVFGAGGLYAGLPPDWKTQDVYNSYLLVYGDGPADESSFFDTIKDLSNASFEAELRSQAVHHIHLSNLEWDGDWTDTKVGPGGYTAKVRRGHGLSIDGKKRRRGALALGIEVPGRKSVFFLGAWDEPSPAAEARIVDVVRGVGRCKHKPKRGCVAVAPTGEEAELPDAPPEVKGPPPH